uniref:T-box domain-containing protein n=1 Tax=Glossina morsitans morsitans TaxID=37546 RepID=A0A1B0FN07_GLOMM
MITMNELVDLRMQQHIAHELYRQQIMQRIPDPFPPMLPIPMPRHVIMPPRVTLPGVEVTLQNDDLWKQFHQIGTEMIITKSGRRMFPSMRLSLSGLEEDTNYCILLEMVPIGDCRYKFSGSQWIPAGGAEPQSPQRMYLHPDSPATGSHWQAQPILFNKVKLTNNTLDSSGHIVLASMHKYQPRIHVIRTADLAQIPWAPQQGFVFPETEFVAVTAYQNDRITKLKIDNNPFAKGFRETGQSRCKRKMSLSPNNIDSGSGAGEHEIQQISPQQHKQQLQQQSGHDMSPLKSNAPSTAINITSASSICCDKPVTAFYNDNIVVVDGDGDGDVDGDGDGCGGGGAGGGGGGSDDVDVDVSTPTQIKRMRSSEAVCSNETSFLATAPTSFDYMANSANQLFQQHSLQSSGANNDATSVAFMHHFQQNMQSLLRPSLVDLACSYFTRPQPLYPPHVYAAMAQHESMVAAGLSVPSLPLPSNVTDDLPSSSAITTTDDQQQQLQHQQQQQPHRQQQQQQQQQEQHQLPQFVALNSVLPMRVSAINPSTTSADCCLTNDGDLSSSDSSLLQEDATITATPTTTTTAQTTASSQLMSDDTLPQSPANQHCNNNNNNNNNNNINTNSNGSQSNDQKKKGFSISAILGAGS